VTTNSSQSASGSRALAKTSSSRLDSVVSETALHAYLREVGRHPVLSAEEQTELARELARTGDPQFAARLVTTNLRLVVKMARQFSKGEVPLLDLIQEGNLGLMHAVRKFDPDKGVKLTSYAAWWIRAYLFKSAMRDARLVRLGTSQTQRKLFFKLRKESARLEALGLEASPEAIAARLDVPVHEVVDMRDRLSRRDVSLDEPLHEDGDGTAVDLLPANDVRSDQLLVTGERDEIVEDSVREFGATLTGRDRIVFEKRMLAEEPLTLRELGELLQVSRERARQLEKAIAKKLERLLRARVPAELLAA
jgi:RNA polymerase sigma-32 factor